MFFVLMQVYLNYSKQQDQGIQGECDEPLSRIKENKKFGCIP